MKIEFKCPHCNVVLDKLKQITCGRCNFTEYNTTDLTNISEDFNEDDAIHGGEYDSDNYDTCYGELGTHDTYFECPFCNKDLDIDELIEHSRKNNSNSKTFVNFLLKNK